MEKISLTALGAAQEVGRSSILIDAGEKYLLDRGVKLSADITEYPLDVKTNLDGIVISHAHLDHSGDLPNLFHKSNTMCYMTNPTLDIADILWQDTIKIAGYEGLPSPFSQTEIKKTHKFTFPLGYNRKLNITKKTTLEFFDAGHILGSALSKFTFKEKTLLYTGDFKVGETRLHNGADLETGNIDYLVMESTYGDREHPSREQTEKAFVEKVQETLDDGGTCLVPSFAVGRSQEIIDILYDYKINAPIFYDGMGQKVAPLYQKYPSFSKDAKFLKQSMRNTEWVRDFRVRKKAFDEPSVIVTTAGMLQGGPAMSYLKKMFNDSKSKILLTGYQVEDTPGFNLLETGDIEIDGQVLKVEGEVIKFDFSAHASRENLLKAIVKWSPEKIALVHGDIEVMKLFKETIMQETGIEAVIPERGKTINLTD